MKVATTMATAALSAPDPGSLPLIPRKVLFGNPDRAAPTLSPDGRQMAFLAPWEGVLNVWVSPAEDPSQARPVTHDTGRGIRQYFWAFTNRHILYIQDKNGDENWRVYAVELPSEKVKDLTPLEGVHAQIQGISEKFPAEILVGLNDRAPQWHDVYRLNIETGERQLILRNEGFVGYIADDDLSLRFAFRLLPDGSMEVLQVRSGSVEERFMPIPEEDVVTTQPLGFDKTGKLLYLLDSRGFNTTALTQVHTDTGEICVLAQDPRADLSGVLIHPTEKTVQAVSSNYTRIQWQFLDPDTARDFEFLQKVSDGDPGVVSRTLDDRFWLVAFERDNGPVAYYLYDRLASQVRFLFTNRPALENQPLANMQPVVIPSRDGWELVSYLTRPPSAGREPAPGPLVLLVHGGPWHRDVWGYHPWHQWLANRGYAVLSVNFRGSTGFGKAFVNAANREWAGKMHEDLIDAVEWAVRERIADPQRIAIMGGSYGGYATLVGLTFTPDVFACGVDIVGPSNLVTLLETIPPYWEPLLELWKRRVGDPTTEEGRAFLEQRSPLAFADRIIRPLLIGHGANDPRVKQSESDQIVKALQDKQIPVTYVLYPDEGHGFARPENNLSFFAIAEAFLAQHLGGRYEPIGEDFEGSSLQVLSGAEQIPGLAEALAQMPSSQ